MKNSKRPSVSQRVATVKKRNMERARELVEAARVAPCLVDQPAGPALAKVAQAIPSSITLADVITVGAALADFFRKDETHTLTRLAGAAVYPPERAAELGKALDAYEAKQKPEAKSAGLALVCKCGVVGCADGSPLLGGRHVATMGIPAPLGAGGWPRRGA